MNTYSLIYNLPLKKEDKKSMIKLNSKRKEKS